VYLTRHSDYTMRLLIYLAIEPERAATIREIAAHYGISRNHLMKVANRAVQVGFVEAVRGRSGGLRLALPPHRIYIGDVLRQTENWDLVECFEARNRCPITGGCGLRYVLKEALEACLAVLDRYSLADIVKRRKALVQLLGMKTA
jgi:Rrf2 family nitric oxide-sensitive transcriptional repressor